jgi:hypothetical protein
MPYNSVIVPDVKSSWLAQNIMIFDMGYLIIFIDFDFEF